MLNLGTWLFHMLCNLERKNFPRQEIKENFRCSLNVWFNFEEIVLILQYLNQTVCQLIQFSWLISCIVREKLSYCQTWWKVLHKEYSYTYLFQLKYLHNYLQDIHTNLNRGWHKLPSRRKAKPVRLSILLCWTGQLYAFANHHVRVSVSLRWSTWIFGGS